MEDAHKTRLNILSVDVLQVFQEKIDPASQIEAVLLVSHDYLFEQYVEPFEHFRISFFSDSVHETF